MYSSRTTVLCCLQQEIPWIFFHFKVFIVLFHLFYSEISDYIYSRKFYKQLSEDIDPCKQTVGCKAIWWGGLEEEIDQGLEKFSIKG